VSFSFCDLLHKDGPVSFSFPSVCGVEMSDFLAEKFKIRFYDFPNHATNICIRIVENPLSVEVSDAPG
jgi:hypothetical protein